MSQPQCFTQPGHVIRLRLRKRSCRLDINGQQITPDQLRDIRLYYLLLLLKGRVRDDQVLLVCRELRLCLDDVQRRKGPDLHLAFIIGEEFLAVFQRLLSDFHVFLVLDQVPVIR